MAIKVFKTIYHYALGNSGGKKHPSEFSQDFIAAADGLPATLDTILTNNGRVAPSGYVRVFDSISNEGADTFLT
jgi:hypothetical protein